MVKKLRKSFVCVFVAAVMAVALSGCSVLESEFINAALTSLRGELLGNSYTVYQYDNYGNLVFSIRGDRIALSADVDADGNETSYLNITIDGKAWEHVGGTLVFVQDGVDVVTDFSVPQDMTSDSGLGLIAVDRCVNNYANLFGRSEVVLVSSQNGVPVGLFQGDSCYTEVPTDLPKTTLVSIDGRLVYIHRANVDIIPTSLFES